MTDVNPKFRVGTDVKKGNFGLVRYRVKDSRKSADGTSYVYDIVNQNDDKTEVAVPESQLVETNLQFGTKGKYTGGKRNKTKRKSSKIKRKSMKKGRKMRRKSMKKGGCK